MSAEARNEGYAHPPITECAIELVFSEAASSAALKKANRQISRRYKNSSQQDLVEAKVDFPNRSAEFFSASSLLSYTSDDQTDILHVKARSALWSKLAPYEGWDNFYGRMSREFEVLGKAWGPRVLKRLGLRYINRLDVPQSDDGIFHNENYIAYRLEVGPLLDPQNGYQWLVRKFHADRKLVSLVQSMAIEPELPGTMAFTLDIDVSIEVDVPQRYDDILAQLEKMRALKNEIFEAGITPQARKGFA